MPKAYFWPVAMIVMGLIFLASNVGLLPRAFWDLWPMILIIVGLGGLLTADRTEWMIDASKESKKSKTEKKK